MFGFWATRRDRARLAVLYALIATYAGSVLLFFVFARYRFPLVPLLALFAAAGLVEFPRFVRESSPRTLARVAAWLLAVAMFCNWPTGLRAQIRATTEINLAMQFNQRGDTTSALKHAEAAVALRPESANAHFALGLVHHRSGVYDEAIADYGRSLEIAPNTEEVHRQLARALESRRKKREALRELARALSREGQYERAAERYGETLDPSKRARGRAALHAALGADWEQAGRPDLARIHYRLALEADPRKKLARDLNERLGQLPGNASEPERTGRKR